MYNVSINKRDVKKDVKKDVKNMLSSKKIVDDYIKKIDWRVNENSNSPYSFGSLNKHIIAEVSKDYWLNEVYKDKRIIDAYKNGDMHIHDLGGLTLYCCGYSLRNIILMGVQGIPNIPTSSPAKHFDAILNQIANLVTIYQNEIMGAVAFNSFDTLLAPYIKKDNLTYEEVKQNLQNFIFSINSNSRAGAEPAFTNITFDLFPPKDLENDPALIGDKIQEFTYKECQKEMDMLNKAFYELMNEGDYNGRPFSYPIPTYNINSNFDFDNPNNDMLFEMTGKFGYPYFANFVNSDMDQSDVRSMCCRLNLDLRELRKRNGGLFGSGDSTGSIGVVTINLPRLAYKHKNNEKEFFNALKEILIIAKDSLEKKRKWLNDNIINKDMLPAFSTYVGTLKNHFSTIGIVGLNEMCENFNGNNILTEEGMEFSIKVCNFIREELINFQEETGNLYNFEATPAESTCYRLAKKDVEDFEDIIVRGGRKYPYYTNSCHMPPNEVKNLKQLFDHQDKLQVLFTGGTVVHIYCDGAISGEKAKHIVKTVCKKYRTPYVSISPLNRYCEEHGYVKERVEECPICGKKLDLYQRITGYLRKVEFFNDGKKSEFKDRNQLSL
ncbi:ribonucleoside triphosphate reductase [Clostridium perfringens]